MVIRNARPSQIFGTRKRKPLPHLEIQYNPCQEKSGVRIDRMERLAKTTDRNRRVQNMAVSHVVQPLAGRGQRSVDWLGTAKTGSLRGIESVGSGQSYRWFASLNRNRSSDSGYVACANSESTTRPEVDFDSESTAVKCRILEAILLIAKEPLSARRLALLAGLADATQARTLARYLNEQYDLHRHAFRIEEVAGGMQLLTRPQFSAWLRRLDHVPREELLSQGMLESLAIVAYRQPLLRAEIEAIRGVSCDEVLRQLMQRDLIRICGRHEDLGRPYLYGTTKRFLLLFGLQSIDSLPRAQKIRSAEADIASRLAGNPLSAQDIETEPDGLTGRLPSPTIEHH